MGNVTGNRLRPRKAPRRVGNRGYAATEPRPALPRPGRRRRRQRASYGPDLKSLVGAFDSTVNGWGRAGLSISGGWPELTGAAQQTRDLSDLDEDTIFSSRCASLVPGKASQQPTHDGGLLLNRLPPYSHDAFKEQILRSP